MASAKTATTTNLMATSIGLLVVGAALVCSQAEASSLARADSGGEHLLNPRPRSDTELNNESQAKSGVSLRSPPPPSSDSQLATALLRSRRWAFLSSQQQQPIAQQQQPLFIKSGPNEDTNVRDSYYTDAQLESDKEAVQRILLQVLEDYNRNKMTQPQLLSAPAPAYYDKWLENNKDVAMDEVNPRAAHYGSRVGPSDPAAGDYYPSLSQSFEKREHVKPCLFNAISCPKYPFRNKGYK